MMYRPEDLDGKKGLIEAFFEDEYSYAELVAIVVDQFFLRLSMFMRSGNQIISSPEITDIFANLDEILVVSQEILSLYQNDINLEDIQAPQRLAGLMMPWIPKLECYCTFVTNLCRAYKVLDSLLESNPKFKSFVTREEICEGMSLREALGFPAARFLQYGHFLQQLGAMYSKTDSAGIMARAASMAFQDVYARVCDQQFNVSARLMVAELQEGLFRGTVSLVTPDRYFVKGGALEKYYNKQGLKIKAFKRYAFILFNDMILYAALGDVFKAKHVLPLVDLKVKEVPDSGDLVNAFRLESSGDFKPVTVMAPTWKERNVWIKLIRTFVERISKDSTKKHLWKVQDMKSLESCVMKLNPSIESIEMTRYTDWVSTMTSIGLEYHYQLKTGKTSLEIDDSMMSHQTSSSGILETLRSWFA